MSKDTRNQDKHPFGWCQKRKPCHKKKNNNSFDDEKKTTIAETDLGSYYKQSEWWLEEYLDKDSGFQSLTSPTNDSVDDYEEIENCHESISETEDIIDSILHLLLCLLLFSNHY